MSRSNRIRSGGSQSNKEAGHIPRGGRGCLGKLLLGIITIVAIPVFTGVVVISTLVYSSLSAEIEDGIKALESARERDTFETTQLLDRNGNLLWEIFGEGKRTKVPLSEIPDSVIYATIATEDDTFYQNIGLDAPSLAAAMIANLRNPNDRPKGASTITQQLVSHIVFDFDERSEINYGRKSKEAILAWIMNRKFTKGEIIEMYLNEIYYGNLAYGIEAAAQTYFDKHSSELNLAESSMLAGLPQSPVELDPYRNLEGAKERQWLVLNLMVNEGYISRLEAESAYLETLTLVPQEVSLQAPHFSVYVRQLLEERFSPEVVANGGLRVTTSLDIRYQSLAEKLARQHVSAVGPEHNLNNAALVAIKPGTGEILAMLGSLDYRNEEIDGNVNVTLSPQQPGSAIKPITYAAALSQSANGTKRNWTAADLLWDVPVNYEQYDGSIYSPVNYDRRFHGPVRLRDALANSYNIPAVLILQDIGITNLISLAARMGIHSFEEYPERYGLSLTLGGGEVTPLELTHAYATFANGGFWIPETAILEVKNSRGEELYRYQPLVGEAVLDRRVAFLISDILDDDAARVPAMGRDNPLELPFPAAAKTGTSNDFRDNWTVGYTPGLVVGVWTGNSDNSEMTNISGLTGAAPLWSAYMQAVFSDNELPTVLMNNGARPPVGFIRPPGLVEKSICDLDSITIGITNCQLTDTEWFFETNEPTDAVDSDKVSWVEIDPGVWMIPAVALPPLPEHSFVQVSDPLGSQELGQPSHCYFSEGLDIDLLPPNSLPDLLALVQDPNIPAIWRISSPRDGDEISGVIPILGTADFDPQKVQFYKLELGSGDLENPHWVTLGEARATPVVRGTLEMLHADALAPGDYLLRLVVVKWDGNYVGNPDTIKFTIE